MAADPSKWRSLLERMDQCHSADDVCMVLDGTMQRLDHFRSVNATWGKLRNKYLNPAIQVLLLFNDAIAETAAVFVRSIRLPLP